ncbi:MAG: KOW domain-containing RNA-binding protein [Ruminococcus sp.]|nr:KOW domain-containing RNA-binding protein [Ruminococcus sp.]
MTITQGQVVRAKAGRDKDGFFVVLNTDGTYAYICNGKRRKVEHPKKKKLIHLQATKTVFDMSMVTNRKIREFLRNFTETTI